MSRQNGSGVPDVPNGSARVEKGKNNLNGSVKESSHSTRQGLPNNKKTEADPFKATALTFPWRNIGGFNKGKSFDRSFIADSNLIKTYILETFLSDWYWNTGLIIGTCFFSWLIARWRFGIFGLVFVLLGSASVYRAEFRRFKRNVRDDIQRITSAERLEKSFESMEWLNSFLAKFWVIYMPALSDTVKTQTNEVLKDVAPGYGIDALTLDEFTLGSKAPRIDSIKSYTKKGKDVVEMDWAFSFTPDDIADMTKREVEKKINPKVALGIRVGKSFVSKNLPILVEDMSISGRVKITLNLSLNFPHIKIVSISLLEPPVIDFALKPVGGDTFGLDIMSLIPGLSTLITTLINSNVGPMLYAPNHLDIDIEELLAAQSNDAIGVVAITLKGADQLKDNINPYVQLFTDNDPNKVIRTDVKAKTKSPRWNETKYILVSSLEQKLNIALYDFNVTKKKGSSYATHEFELSELLQKDSRLDLSKPLESAGKKKGFINYDIRWFPVLQQEKSSTEDEIQEVEIPDSEVGILKLTVHQAKELDHTKSLSGQLNPKADLYFNDELTKTFRTLKRANEPSWEESIEYLVTQRSDTTVKLVLTDTGSTQDSKIGVLEDGLDSIIFNASSGNDVFNLSPKGTIRLSAAWKPISLSGVSGGASYVPPIGVLRLHVRNANDLLNLETVGKVDPYVKVLLNNRLKHQTGFHADTTEPNFNEVVYLPITSDAQHISLEVMDDQNLGKDRKLGSTNLSLTKFINRGPNNSLLFYDGSSKILSSKLQLNHKKPKGEIFYSVSFLPSIPVYSLTELDALEQKREQKLVKQKEQEKELQKWEELYKKHPNEYEWVDVEDKDQDDDESNKEKLSLEQLLTYRSGTLVVRLIGGSVKKADTFVQVLIDNYASPSFTTARSTGRDILPEVGDAFIRDLPNSRLIFRNSKKQHVKESEQILEESSFKTIDILQKSYKAPYTISLGTSKLKIQTEYVPSAIKLPPSETILDTGRAQIEFLDAQDLASADRNGKSDPFVTLELGEVELFKSKVVKKTLNPTWNEGTTVPILSRSRPLIEIKVYDWDRAGKNEFLASTLLDIEQVKPLTTETVELKLSPQGVIRLRVTFQPEYIRPKVGATEFGHGFSAIAGAPLKGVGAAAGLATGVVGGGVGVATGAVGKGGSLFKSVLGGKKSKKSLDQPRPSGDYGSDVQSARSGKTKNSDKEGGAIAAAQQENENGSKHSRSPSQASSFSTAAKNKKSTKGQLIIHQATNLGNHAQIKVSLAINDKLKEIYHTKNSKSSDGIIKWDEELKFDAPSEAEVVFGGVVHHRLSKDQELGTASIKLNEVIDNPREITLNLGQGKISVTFKYSPEPEDGKSGTPPPPGW